MTRTRKNLRGVVGVPAALFLAAGSAWAWQESAPTANVKVPQPEARPDAKPDVKPEAKPEAPKDETPRPEPKFDGRGRKVLDGEPTVLAFKNVTVEQMLPFIVESTGKVVMPQTDILSRKVTVFNDRPIPRQKALDLVILALREAGIAVVENLETIALRDIAEIIKTNPMVIGPDESVLDRTDLGTICGKVF